MKIIKAISVVPVLLLTACGSQGPGETLTEMRQKLCDQKSLMVMVEYTAPESQPLIAMVAQMSQDPKKGPEIKENLASECKEEFKIEKVDIQGDTAVVYVQGDDKPTKMRKVEDKWKMVLDK